MSECPECGGVVKPRRAGRPDTCIKCGHKGSAANSVSFTVTGAQPSDAGALVPAKKKAGKKSAMDFSVDGGIHVPRKKKAKKKRKKK